MRRVALSGARTNEVVSSFGNSSIGVGVDKWGHWYKCYYMGMKTKVRKFGNSLGIILPKEAIAALKVQEGAAVYLTEGPECSLRVSAGKPDFVAQMKIGEDLMQRYRNALQELAK